MAEMVDLRTGAELSGMLPALEQEVERMKQAIVVQVLTAVNKGELTPEYAQEKWYEFAAAHKLLNRFKGKVAVAVGRAETLDVTFGKA